MTAVYVVGGEEHGKLKSYLETRGSLDIVGSVDYLSWSKAEIQSSIIKADKMIYLYMDESINIREEMNVLRGLLSGDGFFRVEEILFFILDTPVTKHGIEYIKSVEAQLKNDNVKNLPKFDLKISQEVLSYEDIYAEILGLGDFGSNFKNNRVAVYRVERGSDAKRIYEGTDNRNMSVIPYDLSNIKIYNDMKATAALTEYFNPIVETTQGIEKYSNPRIGTYEVASYKITTKFIFVIGDRYTGKTTCACSIGTSMASAGNKVLLADLTGSSNVTECMQHNHCEYEQIKLNDYIGSCLFDTDEKMHVLEKTPELLAIEILLYLVRNCRRTGFNAVIVELPIKYVDENLFNLLEPYVSKVVYTTNRFEDSIMLIQDCERKIKTESICLITSSINLSGYKRNLSDSEIKDRLRSISAVATKPLEVSFSPSIYNTLFGGRL